MRTRNVSRIRNLGVLLGLVPGAVWAGNGSFDSGSNKFNMVFSVRWNASAADLADICDEIQTASGILLDATDGANQFGVVLIANGSTASNAADYWILNQDGRSQAPTCNFGESGEHCTLYRGAAGPSTRWEEVIVHESAHYVYCVRDEYEGPSAGSCGAADCNDNPSAECIVAAGSACIMEGPDSDDSEFCWSGNHDPDNDTEQECDKCVSCWETIASKPYNVALPAGAPVEAAPAADPIACIFLAGTPRIILVLDRSGSMLGTRLADAKKAAKLVADLVETGTYLGVGSFSDGGSLDYDLQTIDAAADRTAAKAAIDGLVAGGQTNYSAGLDIAHAEFIDVDIDAANKTVIFLSDGANNRPLPDPDGELFDTVADLDADDIVINTIGIGSTLTAAAEDRLRDMADDTGGEYFRTPIGTTPEPGKASPAEPGIALTTQMDIKPNFARSWALGEERTEILAKAVDVPPTVIYCDTVFVDPTTAQATFVATWRASGTGLPGVDYRLVRPDGLMITPAMSGSPGILYVQDSASEYAFYKIGAPAFMPGTWQICFLVSNSPSALSMTYQVFSRSPDIWVSCRTKLPRAHGFGEDILVEASAYYQARVSNIEVPSPEKGGGFAPGSHGPFAVTGTLLSPGGAPLLSFTMADDGSATSGDEVAADGEFTGRIPAAFMMQQSSGSYTACVDFANFGGAHYAHAHAKPDPKEMEGTPPIPHFVRRCYMSVVYDRSLDPTGAPEPETAVAPAARILAGVPNPFNPGTRIEYEVAVETYVRLDVYDVRGQLVRRLVQGRHPAGKHAAVWDGRDAAGRPATSGVYFAVLRALDTLTAYKLQLVR